MANRKLCDPQTGDVFTSQGHFYTSIIIIINVLITVIIAVVIIIIIIITIIVTVIVTVAIIINIYLYDNYHYHYHCHCDYGYIDTVACASPETCMEACGNPKGCSNTAYPTLVLGIMPAGEFSGSPSTSVHWFSSQYT